MNFTDSKLPSSLNIIKSKRVKIGDLVEMPELPDWFNQPELWSKDDFLTKTQNYLFKKMGSLTWPISSCLPSLHRRLRFIFQVLMT